MSNFQAIEEIIKFYKEGDGNNVYIFSPFYPFSNVLIKKLFKNLNIPNYQFIFTSIVFNKNLKIDLYSYHNFINLFSKVIKLIYPKKIHLVCLTKLVIPTIIKIMPKTVAYQCAHSLLKI